MGLTRNQIFGITIAVLGVLMVSTAQLTDLFGPAVTKTIVSTSALLNSILGAVLAAMTGQAGMVKDVSAIHGVEPIQINKDASVALSQLAVDPTQDNITVKPEDINKVMTKAQTGATP